MSYPNNDEYTSMAATISSTLAGDSKGCLLTFECIFHSMKLPKSMSPFWLLKYITHWPVVLTSNFRVILYTLLLSFILKYIADKCRRRDRFKKAASLLPGPKEIPLLGNGAEFYFTGEDGIVGVQLKHYEKYGPMYRIWFGNTLWIALSDPEDLRIIFQNTKTVGRRTLRPLSNFFGDGITFTPSISRWKSERIRLQPTFTKTVLKTFVHKVNEITGKFVDSLQDRADGQEFDVKELFSSLMLDIVAEVEFGCSLNEQEKENIRVLENSERLLRITGAQIFFPVLHTKIMNFLLYTLRLGPLRSRFLEFIKKMLVNQPKRIEEAAALGDTKINELLSSSFVSNSYRIFQNTGDEQKLLDELITLFLPATAPTSRLLSYVVLMLAIHSDVQEKLVKEIDTYFNNEDRDPDYDDLAQLPYLDQVLKESLRLYMPAAYNFRELDVDMSIKSHDLPAGTGIMICIANLHFNPEYYPEPRKFNPENFSVEAKKNRSKYTFLPFGSGARRCLGEDYTIVISKLILISVIRNFQFHTTMKMEDVKMKRRTVSVLTNGNYLSMKRRIKKIN